MYDSVLEIFNLSEVKLHKMQFLIKIKLFFCVCVQCADSNWGRATLSVCFRKFLDNLVFDLQLLEGKNGTKISSQKFPGFIARVRFLFETSC